ncbi:MAG TPA: glycosyltransferase [Polyangiaceae bacterium]|nr:glycosyltransferase [Polyangiaceae bacterium]
MTRLLALVQKPLRLAPGQRFRLEQWAPHLEARHGIALDFVAFESPRLTEILYRPGHHVEKAAWMLHDLLRRRRAVSRARGYDGVVIYREAALIGPAIYERLLARWSIPFILDFDDAIWIGAAGGANGVFSYLHFAGKTSTICRLSAAVTVGNEYLGAYARRHAGAVFVVPTSIELARYAVHPQLASDAPFTVVWSGTHTTLAHLELARAPIEELARRRRVVLRVVGSQPPARPFAGVETQFVRWSDADEARQLGPAHVGIMPLPDDPLARGKCGCKALQYMAVGLPAVVSPVGVNVDIIQHGQNGLLASSPQDWIGALERLADSPDLRRQLGAAGRRTVEERYSAESSAEKFAGAVRHAIGRARAPSPVAAAAGSQPTLRESA